MQEIKFCQYCRNKELDIKVTLDREYGKKYCVHCRQCGAQGPIGVNSELAILKWNSRIQEVSQEILQLIKPPATANMQCPIMNGACMGANCMMWIWVGNDKGRCGLVNTMYMNSTRCGAV